MTKSRQITNPSLTEAPNVETTRRLADSKKEIDSGEYYNFKDNDTAFNFLVDEMKLK